ncbi:predicted protein [Naegleria gruberi]|uniref:Predicted protein n=1 Tax=Naegleria gruberi TaxID=5762 RepID=D2VVN3_NAEGR|nr:uncharacterized protein NAEGRDRAFT_59350 [Naegleria gruberi]EFC39136.1 predicted protein [Naegleria gruberi]|eukprot:XP_002671880.1 predicted protein [Naegleria gruberi strain NEG-M]
MSDDHRQPSDHHHDEGSANDAIHASDDEENTHQLENLEMRELNRPSLERSETGSTNQYYENRVMDDANYLYTADDRQRSRQPLINKRKVSNSIITCCTCCCCCIPIGIILLLIVYLFGLMVLAPQITTNYQAKVSESKTSGATSAENIRKGVISQNGLGYVLMKNTFNKKRFSALLHVYTGSVNEEESEQGISHMVEHMAFDNSKSFKGRGGVWRKIENSNVGGFNAFTSFRSTVYELLENKIDDTKESFEDIMDIFFAQVQQSEYVAEYVETEKGAVLGEARRANNSYYHALTRTFENHGGSTFTIGKRFPIGKTDVIRSWTVNDLKKYYDKWYKLSNMKLYIVGDFELDELEKMVKEYWSSKVSTVENKPEEAKIGFATPVEPLIQIEEVNGLNGIFFNLITTSEYQSYPRDYNFYRRQVGDLTFQVLYALQVMTKMTMQYPDLDLTIRMAGCSFTNEFAFGSKIGICSIMTPGPQPELSTWREDFKIGVEELKSIADEPSSALLVALSYALDYVFSAPTYFANSQDSTSLVYELLGNEDPKFEYLNVHDNYASLSKFLGVSFALGSTADHVKANAQYLIQGLSDIITKDKPVKYANIRRTTQMSASIIMGKSDPKSASFRPTKEQIASFINTIINSESSSSTTLDASTLSMLSSLSASLPSITLPTASSGYKLVQKKDDLSLYVYSLSNDVRVNIKKSDSKMAYQKGLAYIEIVALGGKNTENSDIKGACTFVNQGYNGGTKFVASTVSYYPESTSLPISCSADVLSISTTLSEACINYPESYLSYLCKVDSTDYKNKLLLLRLSMNPIFNNNVKKKVITKYQKELNTEIDDQFTSVSTLNTYSVQKVLKSAFPDEHRFHGTSIEDLKKLNPLSVQEWVSQHFSIMKDGEKLINRFEINIVGDVSIDNIMPQLETWFGSIPVKQKPTIVGFDLYDKNQASNFEVTFPKTSPLVNSTYSCEVNSYAGEKALVTAIYPIKGANAANPSLSRALLQQALLSAYSFEVIRSQGGFSYFAVSRTMSTLSLNGFGLATTMFLTGDYPNHSQDILNIQRSVEFWISSLKKELDENFFNDIKNQYKAAIENDLESEYSWFGMIRGLSLTAPASYSQDFVRTIDDVDIVSYLKDANYENFKDVFSSVISEYERGLTAAMIVSRARIFDFNDREIIRKSVFETIYSRHYGNTNSNTTTTSNSYNRENRRVTILYTHIPAQYQNTEPVIQKSLNTTDSKTSGGSASSSSSQLSSSQQPNIVLSTAALALQQGGSLPASNSSSSLSSQQQLQLQQPNSPSTPLKNTSSNTSSSTNTTATTPNVGGNSSNSIGSATGGNNSNLVGTSATPVPKGLCGDEVTHLYPLTAYNDSPDLSYQYTNYSCLYLYDGHYVYIMYGNILGCFDLLGLCVRWSELIDEKLPSSRRVNYLFINAFTQTENSIIVQLPQQVICFNKKNGLKVNLIVNDPITKFHMINEKRERVSCVSSFTEVNGNNRKQDFFDGICVLIGENIVRDKSIDFSKQTSIWTDEQTKQVGESRGTRTISIPGLSPSVNDSTPTNSQVPHTISTIFTNPLDTQHVVLSPVTSSDITTTTSGTQSFKTSNSSSSRSTSYGFIEKPKLYIFDGNTLTVSVSASGQSRDRQMMFRPKKSPVFCIVNEFEGEMRIVNREGKRTHIISIKKLCEIPQTNSYSTTKNKTKTLLFKDITDWHFLVGEKNEWAIIQPDIGRILHIDQLLTGVSHDRIIIVEKQTNETKPGIPRLDGFISIQKDEKTISFYEFVQSQKSVQEGTFQLKWSQPFSWKKDAQFMFEFSHIQHSISSPLLNTNEESRIMVFSRQVIDQRRFLTIQQRVDVQLIAINLKDGAVKWQKVHECYHGNGGDLSEAEKGFDISFCKRFATKKTDDKTISNPQLCVVRSFFTPLVKPDKGVAICSAYRIEDGELQWTYNEKRKGVSAADDYILPLARSLSDKDDEDSESDTDDQSEGKKKKRNNKEKSNDEKCSVM